jgi:hypothetical protein
MMIPWRTKQSAEYVGTCEALFNPFTDAALDNR